MSKYHQSSKRCRLEFDRRIFTASPFASKVEFAWWSAVRDD